jgi:hypothetical protein
MVDIRPETGRVGRVARHVLVIGAIAGAAVPLGAQATPAVTVPVVDSAAVRAIREARSAGRAYLFGSVATVAMERAAPELPLVDTVTTLATLGVTLVPGADGARDAIAVLSYDSLVVKSTGLVRRPSSSPLAGESMRVRLDDGRVARVAWADGRSGCDSEAPLAGMLAELVPAVRSIDPGASWSDTTSVVACRAGVPVTVTTVWRYTVRDETGPAVGITRDGTIAVSADAAVKDQRLVLSGTGSSTGAITVDRVTRAVRTVRATSAVVFEIGNGQQVRRFTQIVSDEVRLAP